LLFAQPLHWNADTFLAVNAGPRARLLSYRRSSAPPKSIYYSACDRAPSLPGSLCARQQLDIFVISF